jgi:hypothetical protein
MKYNILANGELVATMRGDFKDAKSPILLDDESTPYNVGDFSHRPKVAAEAILLWESSVKGSRRVSILTDDEGERYILANISIFEGV